MFFYRTILPNKDKNSTSTNHILEAYENMSKQYLKLITSWCISILLMNCFYIVFSLYKIDDVANVKDLDSGRQATCIAIGVILHYFLLSSFCFSFAISVVQYVILCRSFKIYKYILFKSIIFALSKNLEFRLIKF
jgi:hypothetical protein